MSAPFPIQSKDTLLRCAHETTGVDMCVSPERFILLDTQVSSSPESMRAIIFAQALKKNKNQQHKQQPLLSPSLMFQMLLNDYPLPSDVTSHENFQEIQSIQLAVLMFSVCHVVIVLHEWLADVNFWKFLRTVEMLKYRIPDVASPTVTLSEDHSEQTEYYPDLGMI